MSSTEEYSCRPCRRTVLPPLCSRTLHHPSFMPLYVAADDSHSHQRGSQTVHPIIPAEVFYSDPTVDCMRIPNMLSWMRAFDCSQLNTPPPIMSTYPAPPNRPDPFRSGWHPTRNLGSPTWRINTIHLQMQPRQFVIQLTQEEEQAVTILLKLRHQEPSESEERLPTAHVDFSSVVEPQVNSNPILYRAERGHQPICNDRVQYLRETGWGNELQHRGRWSDSELEAANTLISGFNMKDDDLLQHSPFPDCVFCQTTKTQQDLDTLPALLTFDCTQNNTNTSLISVSENGNIGSVEDRSGGNCRVVLEDKNKLSALGDLMETKEQVLSDLEREAVQVLLSFADVDIVQ